MAPYLNIDMIEVLTTFHKAGWEQYGKRMVETFLAHWPMDNELEPEDSAPNFTGIVEILGCMFAPDECIPEKRKAEKEMDR